MRYFLIFFICFTSFASKAANLLVGKGHPYTKIKVALFEAKAGDTVTVHGGLYKEGNILIDKSISFLGKDLPVLDGDKKFEVLTIKASHVTIQGFRIQHSGYAILDDPGGI